MTQLIEDLTQRARSGDKDAASLIASFHATGSLTDDETQQAQELLENHTSKLFEEHFAHE